MSLLGETFDELVDVGELEALPATCHGAEIGIDLHGRGPLSHRIVLDARPQRFIGFRHVSVPESVSCAEFDPNEHEVARWCRLLAHAGFQADPELLDLPVPIRSGATAFHGATLLHPGAASESRRWPIERWIDVARAETTTGRTVILTGGANEIERVRAIAVAAKIPPERVFANRTNLEELAGLVANAGRVVCGDTGVAHLASAYRRPSVVLFGPTPPDLWGPPKRPLHRVIWAGKTGDPHGSKIDAGLQAISVASVIANLNALPDAM